MGRNVFMDLIQMKHRITSTIITLAILSLVCVSTTFAQTSLVTDATEKAKQAAATAENANKETADQALRLDEQNYDDEAMSSGDEGEMDLEIPEDVPPADDTMNPAEEPTVQ